MGELKLNKPCSTKTLRGRVNLNGKEGKIISRVRHVLEKRECWNFLKVDFKLELYNSVNPKIPQDRVLCP